MTKATKDLPKPVGLITLDGHPRMIGTNDKTLLLEHKIRKGEGKTYPNIHDTYDIQ